MALSQTWLVHMKELSTRIPNLVLTQKWWSAPRWVLSRTLQICSHYNWSYGCSIISTYNFHRISDFFHHVRNIDYLYFSYLVMNWRMYPKSFARFWQSWCTCSWMTRCFLCCTRRKGTRRRCLPRRSFLEGRYSVDGRVLNRGWGCGINKDGRLTLKFSLAAFFAYF